MTTRRRAALVATSVALAVSMGLVLADQLGNLRWFWPYDTDVLAVAILLCIVCTYPLCTAVGPMMKEYQARIEREDSEHK